MLHQAPTSCAGGIDLDARSTASRVRGRRALRPQAVDICSGDPTASPTRSSTSGGTRPPGVPQDHPSWVMGSAAAAASMSRDDEDAVQHVRSGLDLGRHITARIN
jgi:hypothetical protein